MENYEWSWKGPFMTWCTLIRHAFWAWLGRAKYGPSAPLARARQAASSCLESMSHEVLYICHSCLS